MNISAQSDSQSKASKIGNAELLRAKRSSSREWDSVASAWEANDRLIAGWESVNEQIIKQAGIARGYNVVDIGSGTGQPALAIARNVGENGSVAGFDFSDGMLSVARRKAAALKLQTCDVTSLPLEDASCDAASSRFCIMLLPELDKTLREVFRVLKPGACFAASVWGVKEKNPSITIPMEILMEYCPPPDGNSSRPQVFSLSKPGVLKEKLRDAGFSELTETEVPFERKFPSGTDCIKRLKKMAAPFKKMFASIPPDKKNEAEKRMVDAIESFRKGAEVILPSAALIVSGKKP